MKIKCLICLVTNMRAVVLKAFTVPGLGDIRQESFVCNCKQIYRLASVGVN